MSKPDALKLAEELFELDGLFTFSGLCGEAADELRRLHAETTNQKDWLVECRKWEEEAKRLTLENEALRKYAERYRWLRDEAWGCNNKCGPHLVAFKPGYLPSAFTDLAEEAADAAIDAAMKGQA